MCVQDNNFFFWQEKIKPIHRPVKHWECNWGGVGEARKHSSSKNVAVVYLMYYFEVWLFYLHFVYPDIIINIIIVYNTRKALGYIGFGFLLQNAIKVPSPFFYICIFLSNVQNNPSTSTTTTTLYVHIVCYF